MWCGERYGGWRQRVRAAFERFEVWGELSDTELVQEFFAALSRSAGMTLHIKQLDGENSHHIVEAMFKAVGRALKQAVAVDPAFADEIPSTKGVL